MPIEYQYSAAPQPLKPTKKYRSDDDQVTLNYLADPRVIKGNTHALARQLALNKSLLGGGNTATMKPGATSNGMTTSGPKPSDIPSMPSYQYTVHRYVSDDTNLDLYLTEQEVDPKVHYSVDTQTDRFQPRPQTPDFIPRKTGIDISTQVDDVNELFNFDEEVRPLVTVIVAKTLEQALFEVKSEMELLSLEEDALTFIRQKQQEEEWIQQKLKETKEEEINRVKTVKALSEEHQKQLKLRSLVAGLQCMRQVIPSAFDLLCEQNFSSGVWIKENEQDVKRNFYLPSAASGGHRLELWQAAREMADELLNVAQERYEAWKPARKPPPRFCDLIVTIRAANLTFAAIETADIDAPAAAGEDGEAAGASSEEPIARDIVVTIRVTEDDSINDINMQINGALRAANATANVPITVVPYFFALLGAILTDVPILNFPVPESLQILI